MFCKLFLIFILVLRMIAVPVAPERSAAGKDPLLESALSFISDSLTEAGAGSEWAVMALAAGGKADGDLRASYLASIREYAAEKLPADGDVPGALDKHKATENARVVLALCALGEAPRSVGGFDLVEALENVDWVCSATLNSPIFALIALNSCGSDKAETEAALADYILEKQLADGGWALSGEYADPDVTAMALQALAFCRDLPAVAEAGEKAIAALSEMQLDTGEFRSWGTVNSESASQVVIALCAWGIDPDSDPRFVKNGVSALEALRAYADESGGFLDVRADVDRPGAGEVNMMATEQAALALAAYSEYKNGGGMLYAFGDR